MGFFSRIFDGLSKTRQAVAKEFLGAFGKGRLTDDVLEDLEERLLAADIGPEITETILDGVKKRARGLEVDASQLRGFLAAEARVFLPDPDDADPEAGEPSGAPLSGKPHVILFIGVNGAGKTTSIAKLAHFHKRLGRKVLVAAGDTFRAGAVAQLEVWAKRVGVDLVQLGQGADSAAVAYDAYAAAKARGHDVLIIDTAGRLQNKEPLMEELRKIVRVLRKHVETLPHEALLVIDGNTGQNAASQAQGFTSILPLTGLVITKLDGSAKGGAVLALCRAYGVPVRWLGVGESLEDWVPFDPDAFAKGLFSGEDDAGGA